MYNSFYESKIYNKLHIKNDQDVKSKSMAPLIVDGGSIFKKPSYFLNSILIGTNPEEKEGALTYRNGEFFGFNGEKWVSFNQSSNWKEGEGVLYTDGYRIGINKINPKKMLEVGGDVAIDKKLLVKDEVTLEGGLQLVDNIGKKKRGLIRFWDNVFEGFDGEKWVKFGENHVEPVIEQKIDFDNVEKLKLLNCPLTFINNGLETHFYYDLEKSEFRLEKLHKNFTSVKMEDLSLGNLKVNGDILLQGNGRKTIKNVSDPISENEVATKRYVDQMCSGLQDYIVADYMLLDEDVIIDEDELELKLEMKLEKGDLVFILNEERSELVELEEISEKIRFKKIMEAQIPAKVLIKNGKYGNSEYIIFTNNNFMQLSGMESLEYILPIQKIGKEIKLNYDSNIFSEDLSILEKSINNKLLSDNCINTNNILNEIIESRHLKDNIIESRHLIPKSINHSHLQNKCVGDIHLKDGFLKNHHFSPGIVTEKELSNECINVSALKSNIIFQRHLSKNCINSENIDNEQIECRHLQIKSIDTKHLKEKIILNEHLDNKSIDEENLRENIIDSVHIKEQTINGKHLKNESIKSEHIHMNTINGLHIQENTILGSHIKEQTIIGKHLQQKSIQDWHILEGMIRRSHLEEGCIDSGKLGDKILNERHFNDGSIGSNAIKKNAINSTHINLNTVDDRHIVNASIKSSKIMDGAITESKLSENSISTNKIKDHSISNDKLKLPFIKIQCDPVLTCNQLVNLGETLTIGLNQNYMIPKRRDGVIEFMSSVRFGEEGSGQKMEINMEMDVKSEVNLGSNVKIDGRKIYEIGEIKCFWDRIEMDEQFLKYWTKCDGKRVKKSEYPELARILNEDDDFYLPDLKKDGMEFYIRVIQ